MFAFDGKTYLYEGERIDQLNGSQLAKMKKYTVKILNFAKDLISLISIVIKFHEIRYLQSLNFTLTVTVKVPD